MIREFGKTRSSEQIIVESIVKASSLDPAVRLRWGKEQGQLTPDEAIAHAMNILEAATAAKLDSAVTKLFSTFEGLDLPKAVLFRRWLRSFREQEHGRDLSSVRMILAPDEEPVPVPKVKHYASHLLHMAIMTETEAFLIEYLRQHLNLDEDRINQVLNELRDIMYPAQNKQS